MQREKTILIFLFLVSEAANRFSAFANLGSIGGGGGIGQVGGGSGFRRGDGGDESGRGGGGSVYVVGGQTAVPNEFPYQLAMEIDDEIKCGAAIVNPYYAITAAHCTEGYEAQYLKVLAGKHSTSKIEGLEQKREVEKVIDHEKYHKIGNAHYDDISVLKLKTPFEFNEFIQPIALADRDYVAKGTGIVTGWGVTNTKTQATADKLQKLGLPIVELEVCKKAYKKHKVSIVDTNVCAGFMKSKGKDACQGDSGGPLVVTVDNKPTLVGITSYGMGCAIAGFPGVYTNVAKYREWIDEKTAI